MTDFWREQSLSTILFVLVVLGVGYVLPPWVFLLLLTIVSLVYLIAYWEWKQVRDSLVTTPTETSIVPVSRSQELEERFTEDRTELVRQQVLVKEAIKFRREIEELTSHELRLLLENLDAERKSSTNPEVQSILKQYNAHQIHKAANDFKRMGELLQAKQADTIRYRG